VTGEEPDYRGAALGRAVASVCPGFDPEPIRYLLYEPAMRILGVFGLVVALLAAVAFAAGFALRLPGGVWWTSLLAFVLFGLGVLLVLVVLTDLLLMLMGYHATARYFKNALLTPGVVVSEKPLAVVALAPLSNGSSGEYHGLQRLNPSSLPYHAHQPGTRVPIVSAFVPAEGLDRWLAFSPVPVCWGTGRRDRMDECFRRLGTEDFDRLDACIARGLISKDEDELILLDAHDNKLESFSIKAEREKYNAYPK
jgi:hypothetical protein